MDSVQSSTRWRVVGNGRLRVRIGMPAAYLNTSLGFTKCCYFARSVSRPIAPSKMSQADGRRLNS